MELIFDDTFPSYNKEMSDNKETRKKKFEINFK